MSSTGNTFTSGKNSDPEGTHGPHGSRIANYADPRVDSDADGSHIPGAHNPGGNTSTGAYGTTGGAGLTGTGPGHDTKEGTHGPHGSKILNAVDPRVDSDRDGSRKLDGNTSTGAYGTSGSSGLAGSGAGYGTSEGSHGPHNSKIANAADPRVDSDRDHRAAGTGAGHGVTGSGAYGTTGGTGLAGTGAGQGEGTHGPHSSRVANAADPTVDSDRDHRAAAKGTHANLPGPASDTAGPHSSNFLNKVDPRVDSDLDGSPIVGPNKTFAHK